MFTSAASAFSILVPTVCNIPTVVDGNNMLMVVSSDDNADPTGTDFGSWTFLGRRTNAAGWLSAWYKTAASETGTITVNFGGARQEVGIVAYDNNDFKASPHIDSQAWLSDGPTPRTHTITAHAQAANSIIVEAYATHWGSNPTMLTITDDPSSTNRIFVQATNGAGLSIADCITIDTEEPELNGVSDWTSATTDSGAYMRIVLFETDPVAATPRDYWG